MNIGVHVSLSDLVSLVCMPRSAGMFFTTSALWEAHEIVTRAFSGGSGDAGGSADSERGSLGSVEPSERKEGR